VRGGRFSLTIVRLAMDLVLQTGSSLRGVAASLRLIAERLGWDLITPSYGAVRSWLLRLGCHALLCPLPAGAWVWLIDHTVQIGSAKLLVIAGCPLADVPRDRALRQSDLHLVHLALMEHSTQETVAVELEQAAQRTGNLRQIAADQGSDLEGGIRLFQQQHAGVAHVHDLAHQAANVLKNRWSKDPRWSEFVSKLSQAAAKLRQTRAAHLLPPTVRAKARFMNVRPTLRFARRVLHLLDGIPPGGRVEEPYGWLRDYRAAVANWTSEQAAAESAVAHVRTHGVNRDTAAALDTLWSGMELTPGARDVANRLRASVVREGQQAQPGETLVASTEVLESTFGKLKRLEGSFSGDGFTSLTLVLGAILGQRSEEQVRQALDAVPQKNADSFAQRLLGDTLHKLRRLFVKTTNSVPNPK
jgi:hypothetical protein